MPISLKREQEPDRVISLQKGSKYDLDKVLDPAKTINVKLNTAGQGGVVFACFGLDSGSRAREQFFIYYNQTRSPENGIILEDGNANPALFQLELARLPGTIKKLVFTASVPDSVSTFDISGLDADIRQNNAGFQLRLSGGDFSACKSVIFVELALDSAWQLEAPALPFDGDLGGLVNHFGLEVREDSSPELSSGEPVVQRDGKIRIDGEEFVDDPETDWV
ncbi:MAG: TerD family protein [Treponema sp.]|jgi:tellurite resistance protein TerA|nr:TerD family protein [Treponema sp.]